MTDILAGSAGRTYTARPTARRVRTGSGQFVIEDGAGEHVADVTVSGPPTALLRWAWNQDGPGEPSGVTLEDARK